MKELELYGTAKVGERGQISLPSNLRKEYNINAGDKLLIFGRKEWKKWGFMVIKADLLGKLLEEIEREIKNLIEEANSSENP
jgi:AbrB family looped-hinge helix DNA binding protein